MLRAGLHEALEDVKFALLMLLPSLLLIHIVLVVFAGWSGRILRRRGRLPSVRALSIFQPAVLSILYMMFQQVFIALNLQMMLGGFYLLFVGPAVLAGFFVVAGAVTLPPRARTGPHEQTTSRLAYALKALTRESLFRDSGQFRGWAAVWGSAGSGGLGCDRDLEAELFDLVGESS